MADYCKLACDRTSDGALDNHVAPEIPCGMERCFPFFLDIRLPFECRDESHVQTIPCPHLASGGIPVSDLLVERLVSNESTVDQNKAVTSQKPSKLIESFRSRYMRKVTSTKSLIIFAVLKETDQSSDRS